LCDLLGKVVSTTKTEDLSVKKSTPEKVIKTSESKEEEEEVEEEEKEEKEEEEEDTETTEDRSQSRLKHEHVTGKFNLHGDLLS
jgi:hypothetical protein